MKRWIWTIFGGLSLVACLAVLGAWGESARQARVLEVESTAATMQAWRVGPAESATWVIMAGRGMEIRQFWMEGSAPKVAVTRSWSFERVSHPVLLAQRGSRSSIWNRMGFALEAAQPRGSYFYSHDGRIAHVLVLDVPWWVLMVITAIVPLGWLRRRWIDARSRREGRCISCGYDLRASKGCCPECGKVIETARGG